MSPASPYARKVRMAAILKGVAAGIEEVNVVTADRPAELLAANPLGRVPVLVMPSGAALYDSRVICEAIDAMSDRVHLIPQGQARLAVLRAQALGDGISDSAVPLSKLKKSDPDDPRIDYLSEQVLRGVGAIGPVLKALPGEVTLGHLAIASALGYLDYRHADLKWRDTSVEALNWYLRFSERDEMVATQPKN